MPFFTLILEKAGFYLFMELDIVHFFSVELNYLMRYAKERRR